MPIKENIMCFGTFLKLCGANMIIFLLLTPHNVTVLEAFVLMPFIQIYNSVEINRKK